MSANHPEKNDSVFADDIMLKNPMKNQAPRITNCKNALRKKNIILYQSNCIFPMT